MIHSLPHSKYGAKGLAMLAGMLVVSCGSYQQASYYPNDGIYADETGRVTVERYPQSQQRAAARDDDNVYGNYFGQKAQEYGEILDGEVFTDVDSYSAATAQDSLNLEAESDYYYDPNNTYQGYGGWGDNASSVTVNVYDGWGWGGYGYGYGLGYPYIGYYGWGWNNPWRYYGGYWGYPGYGYGWGWGGYWGYNSWGWGGYYGYPGYWGGYYGYPYNRYGGYYGYGSYAYNRSRRGYYNSSLTANNLRGRSNLNARGVTDSRYRTNSSRSNLTTRSAGDRSSYKYRSNSSGRAVGVDGIARNESYRSARTTRAVPRYNNQGSVGRTYSGSSSRSGSYSRGSATGRSGYSSGTYSRSGSSRSSGNSGYSSPSRSSNYRSSGSSGSYRSSGSRSSGSSGYRSSGSSSPSRSSGSYRSSSGPSRSSGVRSSGSSGGRRNN